MLQTFNKETTSNNPIELYPRFICIMLYFESVSAQGERPTNPVVVNPARMSTSFIVGMRLCVKEESYYLAFNFSKNSFLEIFLYTGHFSTL